MEPWGVNEKSTDDAVEPLSQADSSSSSRWESVTAKRRKVFVALLVAGSLMFAASEGFHSWRKSASLDLSGATRLVGKSQFGKFADGLLKGTSLFGGPGSKSSDKLDLDKTTKMSGAPLSLPLFFEANRGQTDARVKFLARSSGYTLFVTPTETVFAGARTTATRGMAPQAGSGAGSEPGPAILRMKLLQSNPGPEVSGAKELSGKVNYLIGNNPRDWHTGIPLYEEVRSREVYPGIDLVFHGDQQRLEYDFQIAPGADPGRIRFKVSGAEKMEVAENGDLLLRAAKTEFRMRKPTIYQQIGERRKPVDGGFSLQAGRLVTFRVGAYDKSMPLVIDPTIIFASFLGAAGVEAIGGEDLDVTNPSAPRLFVAGSTSDITTFTETNTVIGNSPGAGAYAFVARIDPTTTGTASLNFLTFIGGSLIFPGGTAPCENLAGDIKLDVSGGVGQVEPVLLGETNCRDFPVTVGGPTIGTDDLFITRLTPNGAGIDRSTLFGGNGSAGLAFGGGASLFLNPEGTIVLSGDTTSTDLPTTGNAYSVSFNNGTPGGFDDCFVAKFDRSFNILYLTYLNVGVNSSSGTAAGCGVGAIDPAGKIYVGGTIYSSTAFNLANGGTGANGFQKTFVGTPGTTPNTFVAVLDPSLGGLNQLTYSSYFAGGGGTNVQAGAVDVAHGIAVIGGTTISNSTTNAPDIPVLNAIQATNNSPAGVGTGWIAVIDTTKSGVISLVASTYFGGSTGAGSSSVHSVAIDPVPGNSPTQRIVVGGQTTATNFPTMNPLQASLVGGQNAFVSVLSVPSSGSTFNMSLLFSTYLGGGVTVSSQSESVRGLITDSNHAIYALGRTPSANFFGNTTAATMVNGFQTTCASCGGGTPADDLAIFVLTPQSGTNVPDLTVTKSHSGNFAQGQSGAQFSITVTNSGTGLTVGTVSLADSLPSSLTATAMTGTGWTCSIGTLVCTRSDGLGAGLSYPVITLTVNVAGNAPPSVTNTVTVSGGSETNTTNNTASDVATITSSVGACTNNYIGLTNGSWGTATNWNSGAVPVSTDVACIPSGITVLLNTSLATANQTISALNNSGTLTVSNGPLSVTNNSLANTINVNAGTLAFNGQLTVSGPFSMTNGVFGGTGEVDLNGAFTWSGGTICSTISGSSCATGTVAKLNANGGITFPASSSVLLSFRTLNNNGTITWSGSNGSIDMLNGSAINNQPGSIWNYANDSSLVFGGGNAVSFNNAGTFEKTTGTGISTIGVPFNNTGTVLGNSGTLSFTGGGNCGSTCPGTFTAGTGGTVGFGFSVFAQSGPLNGTGTLNFNGATMDFGAGVETISTTTVNVSAGVLAGAAPGVLNFETRPNWTGGTMCSSLSGANCVAGTNGTTNANAGINFPSSSNVVISFRTLNNNGTATWSGTAGSIDMVNASVINNPLGSVWNYANDSDLAFGGGNAVAFNNGGTFEKTGGTATSTVGLPFNNTGTVLGNAATFSFTGGGNCGSTCSGTFTASAPGIISFGNGIFGQSGPINGTGTVNFNGATMNFGTGNETIATTTVNFTAGILGGASPGVLNFTTPLNWTGGTMCSGVILNTCLSGTNGTTNVNAGINFPSGANVALSFRTLNNNATVTWSGTNGFMNFLNGSVINNPSGSVWNYANDSNLGFGGGSAVAFNNAGTFEKTGGTATTTIGVPFNNTGTVSGNASTLSFTGGGNCGSSCSGTYTAGAAIQFAGGLFAQSGPINGTGTVNFSGATMDFGTGTETISTTTVNFIAGVLGGASPGVLNFTTPLNWTGGTMCSSVILNTCLSGTNGTTNVNSGINFPSSANVALSFRTLNNNATVTWSATNGFMNFLNGSVINNPSGSVWNYANDSDLGFGGGAAVAFNNAGTFEKTGGTATTTIGVPFNNTGTAIGNAATLSFSGGGNCGSSCTGTYTAGTGATIQFGGGLFAQSGPINGAGAANFSGATMDFGIGTETISTTTVSFSAGTLAGAAPGVLNFSAPLNWSGGTMCSSLSGITCVAGTNATTNANAGINFPATSVGLSFRTLNNNGTVTWSGAAGSLDMVNGAIINNPLGSVWNYTNDSILAFGGGAAVAFNNGGTFEKTGGTATTTAVLNFNNTGTVLGNSGTLSFTGGGNCGSKCPGTFTAGTGAAISFGSGVFGQSGPINGAGTVNFNGATMDFGTGTETISTTTVNFSAGTLAGAAPGVLNFSAPLNWSGGTMCSSLSGITCVAGTNATTNANGGINFPASSDVVLSFRTLNNNGTSTWSGAAGALSMINGAVINNPTNSVWNYTNDSFLAFAGGAAVAFNNGGTFEKTGGTATSTVGLNFNNTGAVLGNSGNLSFTGGGNCGSACSGTFTAGTGAAIGFGGNVFVQSGPINGAGTVNFNGATMDFGTGVETISTTTVNFSAGTLAGAAPGVLNFSAPLNWTAGTMCSSLSGTTCIVGTNATTNANAGINFPGSATNGVLSNRVLNAGGTTTWSGSNVTMALANGAIVNTSAGSIWNYTNDSSMSFIGGTAGSFNNNGTFEKTGGTAISTIAVPFNNMGTVVAGTATLQIPAFTQTAGNTILNGGSIQTFNLLIQGGSVTGTGTVQGNVTNAGGSVAPGSSITAGAISIVGIYSQSRTGAYNVKIGGTAAGQFDTLTMSGAATLGGPLNVSLINSFSPALGNTFTILTAASVTGTFSTANLPALSTGLGWQVTYNATNVVLSVVTVSSPVANLNPGSLPFPNTIVNTASTVQKAQLQNTGTAPLLITSIQVTGADAANFSYTPDATQPCPISPATLGVGAICMLDAGFLPLTAGTHNNAQITVTDNSGNVTGSTQTVALSGTGIVLSSIAVTPAPVTITQGSTQQFTATGTYSDTSTQNLTGSVIWASATTSVATINAAGLAQGVAPGTSNITAKQGSITSPAAVLTVTPAILQNIAVTPANPSVPKGLTQQFAATGMFSDGSLVDLTTQVTWNSATPGVATISATGLATGVGVGTSNISASLLGVTSPIDVLTVTPAALQTITVTPATPVVTPGNTVQYTATGHFSDGTSGATSVNWTSSDTTIATLNAAGLATSIKTGGPITITATSTTNAAISGTATLVVASPIGFVLTGSLNSARSVPTATVLNDGRVLVAGGAGPGRGPSSTLSSAELYDPATGTFTFTGSLNAARYGHTATLLADGRVLIAGGATNGAGTELASAEIYDPKTGTFTALGNMTTARYGHAATWLPNGTVLITGGIDSTNALLSSAEIFDPATGKFTSAGNMTIPRIGHTATLGIDNIVIIAGGGGTAGTLNSVEIYDTAGPAFAPTNAMIAGRSDQTASVLQDNLLVAGGFDITSTSLSSAEIRNDDFSVFTAAGSMTTSRVFDTAIILNNGTVLFAGGYNYFQNATFLVLPSAEIYDPLANAFASIGSLNNGRDDHGAVRLLNGKVLVAGGDNIQFDGLTGSGTELASAELFTPSTLTQPGLTAISIIPVNPTIALSTFQRFTATGTGATLISASVTWSSSNPAIISVTNDATNSGTGYAVGPGTATITGCEGPVCGSTTVTVPGTVVLQSIALTPASPSIAKGLTQQFTATGNYSDGSHQDITGQATWASATPGVATINAAGLATGVGIGTSNITAGLSGVTSPIDVLTVTAAILQNIAVTPANPSVPKGLTQQFAATGMYSDGSLVDLTTQVAWSSTAPGVATVNASGLATSVGTGMTNITASLLGVTSPIDVLTVTVPAVQSISVLPPSTTLSVGSLQPYIAIGTFTDGSKQDLGANVSWKSSDTTIAAINSSGLATGVLAGGPVTITATSTANPAVSGTAQLSVSAHAPYAYVEDVVSANCCLDVFDTSTHQTVATIPMTNFTEPLGITPDQSRVYMADYANNIVNVVDTTTNTLMTTIPIGAGPNAVVITPNGQFGYVADFNDNNVPVFSVAANTAIASVPIGFPTGWVSITPDGAWVYAGSNIDGRVGVINTATNTLSSTVTLAAPAGQLAVGCVTGPTFNPGGTLGYFSLLCSGNTINGNTVDVLSIPSNTLVATITVGTGPYQTAISADGKQLYVANAVSNNVSIVDTTTNNVVQTIPLSGHAFSVAVTPDATQLFVGQQSPATVDVIKISANTVTSNIAATKPYGIVIASPPAASAATTLTLTPPNLVFSAQVNGTISNAQTITVKNPGATSITVTSVSLTGPNPGDFRLINGCPPLPIGPGGTCDLQISSDPTTNGQRTALVTINSTNGIAASTQSAPLSGVGISLVSIAVTPASTSVTATKTVQFTATGTFSDNSTQDLTNSVNWSSSSTSIATINANGLATGVTAGGPITITATSGNIFGTGQLTVNPLVVTFPLTVTLIGTGTGSVTDNLGSISCVNTAGKTSGTCSANYPAGTVVNLTASPTPPSTFGGYLGACTGTGACSVTMNSAQSVTASFVPPPQAIPVPLTPGTNVTGMAAYDCPSNPNPSPGNPCLDANAHATALTIGQVLTPFTLTVVATEVPPTNGNGICENGLTPGQDLDCRFGSFFTFQTKANGDTIVPLCYPYANGNCVVYSVYYQNPGQEPDPSMYVGPVNWNITFNNDTFVPPAPYTGSTPHLYYDPSGFVVPNSPYGTDCTTPMLIGNPGVPTSPAIFCQFVFDITTFIDPTKKVDLLIGGKTKVFSDAIVAFPPIFAPVVTVTTTPDAATVTAGSPIGFTITVSNSAAAVANNVSLNTPLPGGTNVNWTISPAYVGPGTCGITGAQGSQVLNCAFGTLNQSTSASLHILSASSAAGTAISPSTVNVGPQQLLSIGSIVVQPITVTFSGLTASQTIPAGTSSITLGGVIGNGTQFAPSGETVSVTIDGSTQTATIASNGVFALQFPTAAIPASTTLYPITYLYAGDSLLSAATNSSTTLTVTPAVVTFPLNVTLIGTGTGMVTDNFGSINCMNTAGVISGTCSASYPSGTVVALTASPTQPSTFGGWLQACSGTAGCSVTMNSAQSVTASFVPPPQAIPVPLTPGTNVTGMAAYNCPSNPNPSPGNPCLDPNAHATSLTIGQVLTPFTLTVVATEVPPTNGNGICENGLTPGQDLDCRFKSFFTFQTNPNGDTIVPLCYPYANGNCVVYSVFFQKPGREPDPSMYVGPVNWNITLNNDTFVPPAPYAGSTPRLYYDPSGFVVPNSPYGTDCTTPMLIGNPGVPTNPAIFCQFVFDITTVVDPTKKVDLLIGGKTKVFSDAVVAIPPVFAPVVAVTTTPDAATVTAGNPIGFTITVSNSAAAVANNVSLNTPLPGGTNVNWTISPAYAGPGTCSITGALGSQVLNCVFGTLNQSSSLSLHIQSASSAAGTAISPSTVVVGTQQLLSIGSIVVQPITVTFSGLTASQTIPVGTSSIMVGGVIGNGTQFAPSGETVSITINGVTQTATIGSNGTFSLQFPTAAIPASTTPYPITYSYAGDSLLSAATDSSTTLTVNTGGEPLIAGSIAGHGSSGGAFYVDLVLKNTGTGVADNVMLSKFTFRTLTGSGSVTYNSVQSSQVPVSYGTLNVGASTTVRIYLNVPSTVLRFSMAENGSLQDASGSSFTFASSQLVVPN